MNNEKRRRALELMKKYYGGIVESESKIVPPELETVSISGTILNFNTDISRPLENLILHLEPTQSGSGYPSPSNIRPITGYDSVKIYRSGADTSNPTIYNISLSSAGTVYGGTLDVKNGVLTVDRVMVKISELTWYYIATYSYMSSTSLKQIIARPSSDRIAIDGLLCSAYKTASAQQTGSGNVNRTIAVDTNGGLRIKDNSYTDPDEWKTKQGNQTIVYPLATTITYQLAPTEVTTLFGDNTIWMDAEGTIDAEFWRIKQ